MTIINSHNYADPGTVAGVTKKKKYECRLLYNFKKGE